jgi:hypothetical protein
MADPKSPHTDRTTPATEAPETRSPAPEPTAASDRSRDVPANVTPDPDAPELSVPVTTVAWIILKAREYDMKEPAEVESDEEDGHNPLGVLEDRADDATAAELRSWISDLNETEQARGSQAEGARRGRGTARYLLGTPQLGDYLEEGLERLGVDTANLEGTLR